MGISKQIGWSPETNLYYQISQQLERLISVTSKVVLAPFEYVIGFTFKVNNSAGNAGSGGTPTLIYANTYCSIIVDWGDGSALGYYNIDAGPAEISHIFTSNSIFDVIVYTQDPININTIVSNSDKGNFLMLEVDYSKLINLNSVDVYGNQLPSTQINKLLSELVANGLFGGYLNTTTQSPLAPPTGQGLIDKATLISRGWTVATD